MKCPRQFARGFTLLEFTIASALSAALVLAMLQAYLAGSSALRWQAASARLDVDGQRALAILRSDIRMAGFFGAAPGGAIAAPPGAPGCGESRGWALLTVPLLFVEAARIPTAISGLTCLPLADLVRGSDVLSLRRVDGRAAWGPAARWRAQAPERTQWYLARAAEGSARFHWVDEGPIRAPADRDEVNYWAFRANTYFVRSYSVFRGDGIPTLCAERLLGRGLRAECLVEGVERMHLEFAVDGDGDGFPDHVQDRPSARSMGGVTHVHIHLLLRSLESPGAARATAAYRLGAEAVEVADDGYLRRVYSATVPVMNRPVRA